MCKQTSYGNSKAVKYINRKCGQDDIFGIKYTKFFLFEDGQIFILASLFCFMCKVSFVEFDYCFHFNY